MTVHYDGNFVSTGPTYTEKRRHPWIVKEECGGVEHACMCVYVDFLSSTCQTCYTRDIMIFLVNENLKQNKTDITSRYP